MSVAALAVQLTLSWAATTRESPAASGISPVKVESDPTSRMESRAGRVNGTTVADVAVMGVELADMGGFRLVVAAGAQATPSRRRVKSQFTLLDDGAATTGGSQRDDAGPTSTVAATADTKPVMKPDPRAVRTAASS